MEHKGRDFPTAKHAQTKEVSIVRHAVTVRPQEAPDCRRKEAQGPGVDWVIETRGTTRGGAC